MINIIKKLLHRTDEYNDLIDKASVFPRHTPHRFQFGGMSFSVTDFISVAWQIKEIFGDEELKFQAAGNNPLIIDCGANVGASVIFFHQLYPGSRIIAFEPDPKLAACLDENLAANGVKGVEVIRKAVWTHNNGISFGSDGADGGSVFLDSNKISVPSESLRELLSKQATVDLIKMDIEGAEVDVLLDCKDQLSKVKNIFVEYHSWKQLPQRLNELLKLLTDSGFRYYIRSLGPHFNPFIKEPDGNMDIQLNIHAVKKGN